jgi:3-deoxy-7-phosphoheptulonate synthase
MVVILAPEATAEDSRAVVRLLLAAGGEVSVSRGTSRTVIGWTGQEDSSIVASVRACPGVLDVACVSAPHELVGWEPRLGRSVVEAGGVPFGPRTLTFIAGPCAVETPEQTLAAALLARDAGASLFSGGAFTPRTSPYLFQGLGEVGLKILADVRAETGLPVVTEIVDPGSAELVAAYADMLQVGSGNMQNFPLLRAVGGVGKPVLLKRGTGATIQEWLMAAEYIAQRGNLDIVLCERGIRTFEPALANTLDIGAVALAQKLSHLPVIVDPSHAGGRRDMVLPLTRAALAAGADGMIVDIHPDPGSALCGGPQALTGADTAEFSAAALGLASLMGRELISPPSRFLSAKDMSSHLR